MQLKVMTPAGVLIAAKAKSITAEAENGSFGLLPRHVDVAAALTPGLLVFVDEGGQEQFVAVDTGVLVKVGDEVLVSTRNAVRGRDLGELRSTVETQFRQLDERERRARSALSKLEAEFVREFVGLSHG